MSEEPPKSTEIDTGGGASVGGNVRTGRDFVGRDQTTNFIDIQKLIIDVSRIAAKAKDSQDAKLISPRDIVAVVKAMKHLRQTVLEIENLLEAGLAFDTKVIRERFIESLECLIGAQSKLDDVLLEIYNPGISKELIWLYLQDRATSSIVSHSSLGKYLYLEILKKGYVTLEPVLESLKEDLENWSKNHSPAISETLSKDDNLIANMSTLSSQLEECENLLSKIIRDNWSLKEL